MSEILNEAPRMKCATCRREVDNPIEIFNGSLICPECGKVLAAREFRITAYNNDLFEKAELYYGKYLSLACDTANKCKPKELQLLLQEALWHCQESSRLGHPGARVLLGSFWQAGYLQRGSTTDRYKMAYHYYNNVCTIDYKGDDEKASKKIQKDAAKRLLRLLAIAQNELKEKRYKLEDNATRLLEKGLIDENEKRDITKKNLVVAAPPDHAKLLRRAFESTRSKEHSPIFGYFILPKEVFLSFCPQKQATSAPAFFETLDSGKYKYLQLNTVCYAPIAENRQISTLYFLHNHLRDASISFENNLKTANEVLLYFYNPNASLPKPLAKYLKKKLPIIDQGLNPNGDGKEFVKKFLNGFLKIAPNEGHIFYLEDLFFALKQDKDSTISTALATLQEAL